MVVIVAFSDIKNTRLHIISKPSHRLTLSDVSDFPHEVGHSELVTALFFDDSTTEVVLQRQRLNLSNTATN